MDKNLSYLVYVPPKSNSHGHSVRDKDINRGLKKITETFTENFGVTQFGEVQVTLYHNSKKDNQIQIDNSISKFKELLGVPLRTWGNAEYPDLRNSITWETTDKSIFDIEDYYQRNKSALLPLENFWIYCAYGYGSGDSIHGSVSCSIESGKLFVRLHLIFPFSIDDPRLFSLIDKVNKRLPFKLSNKHFKCLMPSKKGHRLLKPDEVLQKRIDECLK